MEIQNYPKKKKKKKREGIASVNYCRRLCLPKTESTPGQTIYDLLYFNCEKAAFGPNLFCSRDGGKRDFDINHLTCSPQAYVNRIAFRLHVSNRGRGSGSTG